MLDILFQYEVCGLSRPPGKAYHVSCRVLDREYAKVLVHNQFVVKETKIGESLIHKCAQSTLAMPSGGRKRKQRKPRNSEQEEEEPCVSVSVNQHTCSRQSCDFRSHRLDSMLLDTVVVINVIYFRSLYMSSLHTSCASFPAVLTPTHPV